VSRVRLSVISPTYNERDNVVPLAEEVGRALAGVDHELVFVDDASPDGTANAVEEIGARDPHVRVLRRSGTRALSAAVIEGFQAGRGELLACIDADLQHDPAILPLMMQEIENGADLVIGSRYIAEGGTGEWGLVGRMESRVATRLAHWTLGLRLHDPLSGYFMLRRQDFQRVRADLNGSGFKILLEIAAHLRPKELREVPYTFRTRRAGTSKLSTRVVMAYLRQLWRLSAHARRTDAQPAQAGARR
jgi:dolichol-phosphate mannosyltransferase